MSDMIDVNDLNSYHSCGFTSCIAFIWDVFICEHVSYEYEVCSCVNTSHMNDMHDMNSDEWYDWSKWFKFI